MSVHAEIETLENKLTTERAKLWDAVSQLTPEEMTRPCEGGWSVQDLLAHVTMGEQVNVHFAKLMITQDRPLQLRELARDFPDYRGPFALDDFNAFMAEKWRAKSLDEILNELRQTRADTLMWLETLTPEQLARGGQHAVWGDQTVRGMLKILVIHDKMHVQDLLKRTTQPPDSCSPSSASTKPSPSSSSPSSS